jgi:hypothetical protein
VTRDLTNFENELRSELLAGRAARWEISSPRDELEEFRFFARKIESLINQAEQSEVESLQQSVQHLPKDTQDEFWMQYYPVHWNDIFRSTIRGSVVVSLATFLETFVERLSYHVAIVTKSELRSADLKGSTLERARKFLQAVGNFQKPISSVWDEIGLFFKIRNVIVHNAGFTTKSHYEKAIEKFCQNRSDIRVHNGVVEIKPEFLEFIINQLIGFVDQLESEFLLLCERTRNLEQS